MLKCQFEDWFKGKISFFGVFFFFVLNKLCISLFQKLSAQTSISTILPVERVVRMRKWLVIFRHIGIFKLLTAVTEIVL